MRSKERNETVEQIREIDLKRIKNNPWTRWMPSFYIPARDCEAVADFGHSTLEYQAVSSLFPFPWGLENQVQIRLKFRYVGVTDGKA